MLSNNTYAAHERSYECLNCREAIYNPLCPFCLARQIEAWLSNYPSEIRNKIVRRLKNYIKEIGSITGATTKCIICKKARVSLCPYCFTAHVLEELKKAKVSNIILREFLQFFNFDFEHTGYSKEAERLGVI